MKPFLTLILITTLISLNSCCSSTSGTEKSRELKVMAWNIWHNGHNHKFPEVGCEGTIGILKKSEADVILMVETYGSSAKVADSLGYYHRLLSDNLSIYSRYPIVKTYTFPDSIATFNFGGVEIDMDGTKVRFFDTWLHYLPDIRLAPTDKSELEILAWDDAGSRDEEIRKILSVIKPFLDETDTVPLIMGGDFNSHSHLDWTESTKNMYNHGGAVVNWTVSKEMGNAGFRDSFREIHPDPVKNIGTTWIHPQGGVKAGKPWRDDRIDYIYYKGKTIQAIESQTYNQDLGETISINDKDFFFASDHGLVLTTFRIIKSDKK